MRVCVLALLRSLSGVPHSARRTNGPQIVALTSLTRKDRNEFGARGTRKKEKLFVVRAKVCNDIYVKFNNIAIPVAVPLRVCMRECVR